MRSTAEALEQPLPFAAATRSEAPDGDATLDRAFAVIERDLAVWDRLRRRAEVDPRLGTERERLAALGRDLRALRDCACIAAHPRVRQELLREAGAVTRRMRALGRRLHVSGLDVLPLARAR